MLIKSTATQRLLRENPMLKDRHFGLPYVEARLDKEEFNPTVKDIADAIDFYGYEVRDENIVDRSDLKKIYHIHSFQISHKQAQIKIYHFHYL